MVDKPRFILSKSKLLEQYNFLKNLVDSVSYSLKTNPIVGRVLEENTDSWFTVHFMSYLNNVKDKSRVWFVGQSWNEQDLDALFEKDIISFIVDNENDLKTLLDYISNKDYKINLLLRMRMKEHTVKTEKHFVFGMFSRQINELIPKLRANNKIDKLGIHFHRKTQNISEWSLKEELSEVLIESTLRSIDVVNIGGGLPVEYKNYKTDSIDYIFDKIKELREWLNQEYNVKVIIEPGRFLAASCMKLEATIIAIYDNNIIINCSVYNSAMDTFVAHIRLLVENELENGAAFTIKGLTPDSMDVFRYRVYLDNPKIGDKIVFLNAGAYTYSTDFFNLERPETIIAE